MLTRLMLMNSEAATRDTTSIHIGFIRAARSGLIFVHAPKPFSAQCKNATATNWPPTHICFLLSATRAVFIPSMNAARFTLGVPQIERSNTIPSAFATIITVTKEIIRPANFSSSPVTHIVNNTKTVSLGSNLHNLPLQKKKALCSCDATTTLRATASQPFTRT